MVKKGALVITTNNATSNKAAKEKSFESPWLIGAAPNFLPCFFYTRKLQPALSTQ